MKIGKVQLNNNLILAPMAGYTDIGMRRLAKEYGAGLTVTEMISVKGLLHEGKKTVEMLRLHDSENPSCVQLFGSEPDEFYRVINECRELDKFDIIDINMGCPVPKVVNQGEGSALMKDVARAQKIVVACKKATDRPVSVKFRLGWDSNTAIEFAQAMQDSGADMVCVHGRTKEQLYRGNSDIDAVLEVKKHIQIPLTASGDISEKNYEKFVLADGLMIGRGAIGHADIFRIIQGGEKEDVYTLIKKQIAYTLEYFPERYVVANMRKHYAYYFKYHKVSGEVKNALNLAPDIKSVYSILESIFGK